MSNTCCMTIRNVSDLRLKSEKGLMETCFMPYYIYY